MPSKNEHYWSQRNFVIDLLKQLPLYVFWKNTECVYLGCNDAFAQSVGLSCADDIVGKTDYDLPWTKEESDVYRENDKRVMTTRAPINNIEESQTTLDGQKIVLLTNKVPLLNDEDEVMGVLGIYSDITERKRNEVYLEKAKLAADAANIAKDEFIANMSHDIRTPLSGIIGMSSMIEEETDDPLKKQHAQWLRESGEQLLSLLNSVLALIATHRLDEHDINEESINIRETINAMAQLELPAIKHKNLDLRIDIADEVPSFVITDRIKLHRILLNLLGNAIKFTEKGTITIELMLKERKGEKAVLQFSVKDTGIGIASELQSQVFDRFFKATASSKGNQGGHGIGLHVVQTFISLLHGHIELSSELNKGTTVSFSIPLRVGNERDSTPLPAAILEKTLQSPSMSPAITDAVIDNAINVRVLLIEDSLIALKIAESIISKSGCPFSSATTGEEGLRLAQSTPFDFILTDVGLPGISGIEFAVSLREWEKKHHKTPVPIIGLTAHADEVIAEQARLAGMNAVFTKPITLPLIKEILTTFQHAPAEKITPLENNALLEQFILLDHKAGSEMLGSQEVFSDILQLMISEELPIVKRELAEVYQSHDRKKLHVLSHKLKSSAIYCSTTRLQHACQAFENHLKGNDTAQDDVLYQQLMLVIDQTEHAAQAWIKNKS